MFSSAASRTTLTQPRASMSPTISLPEGKPDNLPSGLETFAERSLLMHRWIVKTGVLLIAALVPSLCAAQLPPGFVDLKVASGWEQVTGICFPPTGGQDLRLFAWEKNGLVWNVENGVRNSAPVVDIREEVGDWNDYGLVGFAVDPNFWTNGYIYLWYVVDYHYLKYYGTQQYNPNYSEPQHDTIGRL